MAQVKVYGLKPCLNQKKEQISASIHKAVMSALEYPAENDRGHSQLDNLKHQIAEITEKSLLKLLSCECPLLFVLLFVA